MVGLLQGLSELPLPQAVDQQTQGHAQGSGQCRQELQQTTSPLNTSRAMAAFERMEEKVKKTGFWTCCQGKCHLPYPEWTPIWSIPSRIREMLQGLTHTTVAAE